jgi:hypothetical protein
MLLLSMLEMEKFVVGWSTNLIGTTTVLIIKWVIKDEATNPPTKGGIIKRIIVDMLVYLNCLVEFDMVFGPLICDGQFHLKTNSADLIVIRVWIVIGINMMVWPPGGYLYKGAIYMSNFTLFMSCITYNIWDIKGRSWY